MELLAVSGVLTLLLAVLLPAAQRAGHHAKAAACQSQLRQWGVGFCLFIDEQGPALLNANMAVWEPFWRPYCDDRKRLFVCPRATRYEPARADVLRAQWCLLGDKFRAWQLGTRTPTMPEPGLLVGSYGLNYMGLFLSDQRISQGGKVDRSAVPVFLDRVDIYAKAQATDEPPARDGQLSSVGDMKRSCIDRHGGGINGLFFDWSVRRIGLKELWTLQWSPSFDRHGPWTRAGGVQPEDWPVWMRAFKDY